MHLRSVLDTLTMKVSWSLGTLWHGKELGEPLGGRHWRERGIPKVIHVLKKTLENWHNFFCKCLEEFTRECIWAWYFLFWKVFNYEFNFFNRNIQIISKFSRLCLLRNWAISSGYRICGHRVIQRVFFYPFHGHGICNDAASFIFNISNL